MDDFISEADDFLTAHPVSSDHQRDDRQTALQLKDILDAYNNSGVTRHLSRLHLNLKEDRENKIRRRLFAIEKR